MTVVELVGGTGIAAGALLSILAAYALIDFPTATARMHAATKSASLGIALITVGSGVASESPTYIGIGALIAIFLFVTSPISGHLLGRAAYYAGQIPDLVHDDLAGAMASPAETEPPITRDFSVMRFISLVFVWMLMWRDVSLGTLLGGSVVALVIETRRRSVDRPVSIRLAGLLPFFLGYIALVVRANLRVAWEVLTPSNEAIREAIVEVPLNVDSTAAALLVANAVTFTPGTLSIELAERPTKLFVHVLHFQSVESTVADVRRVEDLVGAVIPSGGMAQRA